MLRSIPTSKSSRNIRLTSTMLKTGDRCKRTKGSVFVCKCAVTSVEIEMRLWDTVLSLIKASDVCWRIIGSSIVATWAAATERAGSGSGPCVSSTPFSMIDSGSVVASRCLLIVKALASSESRVVFRCCVPPVSVENVVKRHHRLVQMP